MDFLDVRPPFSLSALQIGTFLLFFAGIILVHYVMQKYPDKKILVYPFAGYLTHTMLYYGFLFYLTISKVPNVYNSFINGWSSGIRLHLAVTILVHFILVLKWGKLWKL